MITPVMWIQSFKWTCLRQELDCKRFCSQSSKSSLSDLEHATWLSKGMSHWATVKIILSAFDILWFGWEFDSKVWNPHCVIKQFMEKWIHSACSQKCLNHLTTKDTIKIYTISYNNSYKSKFNVPSFSFQNCSCVCSVSPGASRHLWGCHALCSKTCAGTSSHMYSCAHLNAVVERSA